ncbi:MAG: hypothetical protein ACYDBT_07205 [Desulfobulbaceae bacterium]
MRHRLLYVLVVGFVFVIPRIGYAAGLGLDNAPACETDLDKNFSVTRALEDINRVNSIVLAAGGGPLTYPELGTAKDLMQDAWGHLEQVMNLGALKYSGYCITCNPERYLRVARALVEVSRRVHGRIDYCEFCGLVDTMENNLQRLDYCGYYSNNEPVPTLLLGDWQFGRVGNNTPLCGDPPRTGSFSLTTTPGPRGRRITSCHSNETSYWLLGNELIFVHNDGSVTSILRRGSQDYWEGPYLSHPGAPLSGVTHYIKRKTTETTRVTWHRVGVGDCTGHDVGSSDGVTPDESKALEGYTAVCWDGRELNNIYNPGRPFCTYKNIDPDRCSGGGNPGVMYRAIARD